MYLCNFCIIFQSFISVYQHNFIHSLYNYNINNKCSASYLNLLVWRYDTCLNKRVAQLHLIVQTSAIGTRQHYGRMLFGMVVSRCACLL